MEVSLGPGFLPSLHGLGPAATSRVLRAVQRFQANPSNPGLNFEKLKGRAGARRLWTFRASQSLRVLVAYEGAVVVVLSAGEHQAVYALADNSAFIVRRTGAIGLVGANDSDGSAGDAVRPRVDTGPAEDLGRSILEHWTNSELFRVGFDEAEVDVLRDARDEEALLERWSNADKLDLVVDCMEKSPEQFFQPGMLNDGGGTDFRNAIVERGALSGLSSLLNAEEFTRLLEGPIEEWMLFLHPEQRAIVDRHYGGPARVRGSAGTGKTVVAIHRAAALASRHATPTRPTVLFTTFIKSLPPVFSKPVPPASECRSWGRGVCPRRQPRQPCLSRGRRSTRARSGVDQSGVRRGLVGCSQTGHALADLQADEVLSARRGQGSDQGARDRLAR